MVKMKENIAYIGPSAHNKTLSTKFLIDYLKEFYKVDVFFDYKSLDNNDSNYSALVFFQCLPEKRVLANFACKNIIYFPMYDQVKDWSFAKWYSYKDCKIFNFCEYNHNKLIKWGFNSIYLQYFPEPSEFTPGNSNEIFAWQRTKDININNIEKLFKKDADYKLHLHTALDPNYEFIAPTKKDEAAFKISYSNWFENPEEMNNLIKTKGIYIAPRAFEGIGMSFLEAMAQGKMVVANDAPTMNEYIKNNVTGFLFDYKNPKTIDFSQSDRIQSNAWEFCKLGYEKWSKDKITIIKFIEADQKQIKISLYKKLFYGITNLDIKDIIRFKFGRNGYFAILGFWIIEKKA